jgi:DNA-binding XRE family transcriptional regulator
VVGRDIKGDHQSVVASTTSEIMENEQTDNFQGITPEMYLEEAQRLGEGNAFWGLGRVLGYWFDWIEQHNLKPLTFIDAGKVYLQARAKAEKEVEAPSEAIWRATSGGSDQVDQRAAWKVFSDYMFALDEQTHKVLERWGYVVYPFLETTSVDPETYIPLHEALPGEAVPFPREARAICEPAKDKAPPLGFYEHAVRLLKGESPEESPDNEQLFDTSTLHAPSNPLVSVGLQGIWGGGESWKAKQIWSYYPEHQTARLIHGPKSGGRVTLEVDSRERDPMAVWDFEKVDTYLQSLSTLTSDVALAVLACLSRASEPMIEPVIISTDDIVRLKGITLYGKQRQDFDEKIAEEIDKLRRLVFDIHAIKVQDPATGKWPRQGISWQGDQLFDIVQIEEWQEDLWGGRKRIAVRWSVRAGHWAFYYLSPKARRWVSGMATRLFTLSHRSDRRAEQLAKKIGQYVALNTWREGKGQRLRWTRRTLLKAIGETPDAETRPSRLIEAFDAALHLLTEYGIYKEIKSEPFTGKGNKGWIERYLDEPVEFVLFDDETLERVTAGNPKKGKPKKLSTQVEHRNQAAFSPINLRAVREARDLQQTAVAEILGISRQYYSDIENGKRTPSKTLARKLTAWLEER